MTARWHLFAIAAVSLWLHVGVVLADCDAERAKARSPANSVTVTIEDKSRPRVGVPVSLDWRSQLAEGLEGASYFVLGAPPEVRFAGTGFIALAAGAKGPRGIAFEHDRARGLVVLQDIAEPAKSGRISIIPYGQGQQVLRWAVVVVNGACGEHTIGAGEMRLDVATGPPELVVQDRFSSDRPKERIRSLAGTHEILIYDKHYEVYQIATAARIVQRSGVGPNFSPTGRFVAARRDSGGDIEVVDLVSGTTLNVPSGLSSFVAWVRNDSFAIFGGDFYSVFEMRSMLTDGSQALAGGMGHCRLCKPWDMRFVLDLDNGLAIQALRDDVEAAHLADFSAATYERSAYDLRMDVPGRASNWDLGEPILLSHNEERWEGKVVAHQRTRMPADASPKRSAANGSLRGQLSASQSVAATKSPATNAFSRLESMGLATKPALTAETQDGQSLRAEIGGRLAQMGKTWSDLDPVVASTLTQEGCRLDARRWRQSQAGTWILKEMCVFGRMEDAGTHVALHLLHESAGTMLSKPRILGWTLESHVGSQRLPAVPIAVHRLSETLVAIAPAFATSMTILDVSTGETVATLGITDAALVTEVRLAADGSHVVQLNSDGRFAIYRLADGVRVVAGAYVDDEIIVVTDDGHYDATFEGAEAVQVRFPGLKGLFRYHQFEAVLRSPDLLKAALLGRPLPASPTTIPTPPTVGLALDPNAASGRLTGKVEATSARALSAIRLYVDGRLVQEMAATGTRWEQRIELPSPGGGRWITAVAVDAQGLSSQAASIRSAGPRIAQGTLHAVVIGVDRYEDAKLERLEYAESDAKRFAAALSSRRGIGVETVHITPLLGAKATPASVLAAVNDAARNTGPRDTLVIFYAGHGIDGASLNQPTAGWVLATRQTRVGDLSRTALSWLALADALRDARGKIVVTLDACRSGVAGREASAANDAAAAALITRAGAPIVILAASKGRQDSGETKALGGLFTSALTSAMRDGTGTLDRRSGDLIDLGALYAAVKVRVTRDSAGYQTPWLARNALVGEMSLY